MLYVRKLFTQDLRDGKQIAFPKEPSLSFFHFDYTKQKENREITFTFKDIFNEFVGFTDKQISTRLYSAGSESRMDGEVKAFIRDELSAKVDDLLIFKSKGTKHVDFDFMFVPKTSPNYGLILALTQGDNHTVCYSETNLNGNKYDKVSLQQIYYGVPGTGKSHATNEVVARYADTIRTTFHPDSDYSTFVGAYKPTVRKEVRYGLFGKETVAMQDENKNNLSDTKIEYKFVKQAFLKAYIRAWKKFAGVREDAKVMPLFLVIEEINRGNCAQIFGDLFQLLDRKNGFSEYPIEADEDIRKALADNNATDGESFGTDGLAFTAEQKAMINAIYDRQDENGNIIALNTADKIASGELLALPCNLYIWATMNTSDQSLFPIDSAFKRRWDWKYMPIRNAEKNWRIAVNGSEYDWWQFLERINGHIGSTTNSEDKKLGYFFCKPKKDIIDAETFVGKVIFYLWNDVFKDYGFEDPIFKAEDGTTLTFDKFYASDAKSIREENVGQFLRNLEQEPMAD